MAAAILTSREEPLSDEMLSAWRSIPAARWVPAEEAGAPGIVSELAERGLIVTDDPEARLAELRRRDDALAMPAWNRYAALYQSMTQWSGVHGVLKPTSERKRTGFWPPPPHFVSVSKASHAIELPLVDPRGGLYEALRARRTSRGFDPEVPLAIEELSVLLRYVWGCHGTKVVVPGELTILKKTSPSGGSQHPGEVYPIVSNVQGLGAGIYHYDAGGHALELMEAMAPDEARSLALALSAHQQHCGLAPAVFVMTARYPRNHWKYVAHPKAFRAILVDAGHLSQTFYLVSAELGLGAFVTGAINDRDIAERLGLPAFTEGVLLLLGCGRSVASDDDPVFAPYTPPRDGGG